MAQRRATGARGGPTGDARDSPRRAVFDGCGTKEHVHKEFQADFRVRMPWKRVNAFGSKSEHPAPKRSRGARGAAAKVPADASRGSFEARGDWAALTRSPSVTTLQPVVPVRSG